MATVMPANENFIEDRIQPQKTQNVENNGFLGL